MKNKIQAIRVLISVAMFSSYIGISVNAQEPSEAQREAFHAAIQACKASSNPNNIEIPRPHSGVAPTDAQKVVMDAFRACLKSKGLPDRPPHHQPPSPSSDSSSNDNDSGGAK